MKTSLLGGLALLAQILALTAPAAAGNLYIPLLDRDGAGDSHQRTEVWIANAGTQTRNFTPVFLPAGTSGAALSGTGTPAAVLNGRTSKIVGATTAGHFGLLEISAPTEIQVEARLANTVGANPVLYTPVPVITSANVIPAGTVAHLVGLGRTSGGLYTDLGIVNLEKQAAQCTVAAFRADGSQIAGTASVPLEPLSVRHFGDAVGILGETDALDVRFQVTCDRTFYPYAATFNPLNGSLLFTTPSGSGASTLGTGTTPPPPGNTVVFTLDGLFHTPAVGHEIKQLVVQVPRALALRRMSIDLDVTADAFAPGHESGSHNLIWVYRGKNRSNTIANLNAFGPPRSTIKNTSNVDVTPANVSNRETALAFQQGVLYHVHYVYDAENGTITTTVSTGGVAVATMTQNATAKNRTLTIPAVGFNVQLGNPAGQGASNLWPTYGWKYANLRIEMVPY
jgi:hypothetical protein